VPKAASARRLPETAFVNANSRTQADKKEYLTLDLGEGVSMRLVRIPGGQADGDSIKRPFWMGCFEVTNRQYAQINPGHDSRFEHRGSWIFSEEYLGWPLDGPQQPVVRVSWQEAAAFCERLSERCGRPVRLPSEAQWEHAARAGAATPFWFGDEATDFSPYANLGDQSLRRLAHESWGPRPPDLVARDDRFDDGHLVTAPVGSFAANPLGLFDMHGNAAEWTLDPFGADGSRRAVRGGSWRDLPSQAGAAYRYGFRPYQKVFCVGFRVVCEDEPAGVARAGTPGR
jgi:formylglycine-generating enzyme required for sulfatase activity